MAVRLRIGRRRPNRSVGGDAANIVVLALVGAFMALPMVFAISSAFKPLDEIFLFPPRFLVQNPTLDNFKDLFLLMANSWVPFSRYLFNTLFITVAGTAGHVIVASMAAFVLEKHRFPGRVVFFRIAILALMFAPEVTAIPNYITMAKLGWLDTYWSLVVPALAFPLGLFLMKQFMATVPDSLLESARIDGAREFTVFWRIAMPAVKPGWLTLVIFSFQALWRLTGGVTIYREQLKPLPYALGQIIAGGVARAGVGAAVILVMMVVPVALFIVSQSSIIQTMASSGIKE